MALGLKGGGGGGRGRPYGMMLLLAFGAAVLGVMVLHKLRERRIFTLLIQDKDQDLMTLHLLLQKERESAQEMKRKIEELKAKALSLRTQKMELSNKLASIQSITSSLKEEQRALESTLEEKQNEIKMLREKEIDSSKENSQIAALRELLKQKEAEIEEMKRLVAKPTKIWSVSTDDPSNPSVNLTLPVVSNTAGNGEREESDNNFTDKQSETLASNAAGMTSVKGEGGDSKNISEGTDKMEIQAGQKENLENSRDGEGLGGRSNAGEKNTEETETKEKVSVEGKLKMVEDSQGHEAFIARGENDNRNETGVTTSHLYNRVANTEGEGGNSMTMAGKDHRVKLDILEGGERRPLAKMSKDRMKLKKMDRSRTITGANVRGEYGHRSTTRTSGRRIISREISNSEDDDRVSLEGSRIITDITERKRQEAIQRGGTLDHKEIEVSGQKNFGIFKYPKDEGLRTSSDMDEKGNLKGKDQEVVSSEGKKPDDDVIKQQGHDTNTNENPENAEITHVMKQPEKTEAAWTEVHGMSGNEEEHGQH